MNDATISLDVGGQIVKTRKETLLKAPFFEAYLKRWKGEQIIFLDLDYNIFIHVLNYLRNEKNIPPNTPEVRIMLDYLGLSIKISPINAIHTFNLTIKECSTCANRGFSLDLNRIENIFITFGSSFFQLETFTIEYNNDDHRKCLFEINKHNFHYFFVKDDMKYQMRRELLHVLHHDKGYLHLNLCKNQYYNEADDTTLTICYVEK